MNRGYVFPFLVTTSRSLAHLRFHSTPEKNPHDEWPWIIIEPMSAYELLTAYGLGFRVAWHVASACVATLVFSLFNRFAASTRYALLPPGPWMDQLCCIQW
jgi:hypothetical protein